MQRPHVVEAIAELDEDDADVARHREQHLAEVLRLLLLSRRVRELAELRHAIDEERDLLAENLAELIDSCARVLDAVMQQPRTYRSYIQLELGADLRHG